MTYEQLFSLYNDRKSEFELRITKWRRRSNYLSWLRVSLMAGALLFLYFAIAYYVFLYLLVMAFFAAYASTIVRHDRLKEELQIFKNLVKINEWELQALRGDHSAFPCGDEFSDARHPFSLDLDLYGSGSIFQLFNRTSSEQGSERLASMLAHPLSAVPSILARQEAIRELSGKIQFRQNFHAMGLTALEKKEDQRKILEWLQLPSFIYGKAGYRWMLVVAPTLGVLTLLVWILTGSVGPFALVALAQWAIIGRHMKHTTLFQDYVGSKRQLLEKYLSHFDLLSKEQFDAAVTVRLARRCNEAHHEVKSLVKRVKALDLRLNLLANILFNSTVLYDLQCLYRLEEWREKNRNDLREWLESISEADALNSFGTFSFNHPDFVWPEFNHEQRLNAKQLGHPMIDRVNRVNNDVRIDQTSNVWLVTGANMAGKSTFLRTVGTNIVLALTGSVVCAQSMDCPVLDVFTGMRNTDSIQDHQSYFYAELLRLQELINQLKGGRKLLILLDEILRGTNSTDKLTGSQELIRQLIHYPCLALVATHDVTLAELEQRYSQVCNYHFETTIRNDELHFDYLLKHGVSTGKNATFLMRKMGIIGPD